MYSTPKVSLFHSLYNAIIYKAIKIISSLSFKDDSGSVRYKP